MVYLHSEFSYILIFCVSAIFLQYEGLPFGFLKADLLVINSPIFCWYGKKNQPSPFKKNRISESNTPVWQFQFFWISTYVTYFLSGRNSDEATACSFKKTDEQMAFF